MKEENKSKLEEKLDKKKMQSSPPIEEFKNGTKPKLLFTEEEMEKMFDPRMVKRIFKDKE